ncbi:unnamed protein product [Prorocentrum cordatum]|uniref:Peptidylprolyl isomerase n=1 Tax=Prorocentrum cordatum TaxID=2364126 RepID=A0ABN9UWE8_9DINO|nr:unnamed protein product [Polarella glacialis]
MAARRSAPACLLAAALVALCGRSASFVGLSAPGCERGGRLVARVSAEYLEPLRTEGRGHCVRRCGRHGSDRGVGQEAPFRHPALPAGQRHEGRDGDGGDPGVPLPRGPPGPGVRGRRDRRHGGEVRGRHRGAHGGLRDFGKIMDLLDDEVADPRFSKSTALALEKLGRKADPVEPPIEVVYATVPGYVYAGAEMKADGQDGFAR